MYLKMSSLHWRLFSSIFILLIIFPVGYDIFPPFQIIIDHWQLSVFLWSFYTFTTCDLQTCHTHLHIAICQLSRGRLTELWMFQEAGIDFLMLNNWSRVLETCFMVFLASQCVEIWKRDMGCPLCVFNENWPSYSGTALFNKTCCGFR